MTSQPAQQKLALFALTAMVVGSMVGSRIFSLPRTFGLKTGPFGAIIAWCIAGGGMYMPARVFQALAERLVLDPDQVDSRSFFPVFGDGNTVTAIILASIGAGCFTS
jgi:arginine:ornithine antiporter/lysine permease